MVVPNRLGPVWGWWAAKDELTSDCKNQSLKLTAEVWLRGVSLSQCHMPHVSGEWRGCYVTGGGGGGEVLRLLLLLYSLSTYQCFPLWFISLEDGLFSKGVILKVCVEFNTSGQPCFGKTKKNGSSLSSSLLSVWPWDLQYCLNGQTGTWTAMY